MTSTTTNNGSAIPSLESLAAATDAVLSHNKTVNPSFTA
jgi:hypothetical protein